MTLFQNWMEEIAESPIYSVIATVALFTGVIKITNLILSYGALLGDLLFVRSTNFNIYGAGKGNWAVITGASDGIGKEYALQLAKKGFSIVLVSRTEEKLKQLSKEIETKYKVDTKYLAIDISSDSSNNYTELNKILYDLKITILINNVGISHSIPVTFIETEEEELRNIITVNNTSTLLITKITTPIIIETVEANRRANGGAKQKGLILTMGSFAGLIPTPYLATYSGSKAFLQHWSSALKSELAEHNVDVELAISYLVTSAMSKIRRTSASIPNPKKFVASTLNNIGRRVGAQERFGTITPFWSHALMHWWIENTLGVYSKMVVNINLKMHKDIRTRALKKAARLAKKE